MDHSNSDHPNPYYLNFVLHISAQSFGAIPIKQASLRNEVHLQDLEPMGTFILLTLQAMYEPTGPPVGLSCRAIRYSISRIVRSAALRSFIFVTLIVNLGGCPKRSDVLEGSNGDGINKR